MKRYWFLIPIFLLVSLIFIGVYIHLSAEPPLPSSTDSTSTQPSSDSESAASTPSGTSSAPNTESNTVPNSTPATEPSVPPTTVPATTPSVSTPTTPPTSEPTSPPPTTESPIPTEHKHSYTATHIAASCAYSSHTLYTCSCGNSYTEGKTAGTHSFGQWYTYKEPTTTQTGLDVRECVSCGYQEQRSIDKLSDSHTHSYVAEVTAPTCTTDGFTTYTCACGKSYVKDKVLRLGHNYKTDYTPPTCLEPGKSVYTCTRCSYQDETVWNALGHDFRVVMNHPASCEHYGVYQEQCINCTLNKPEIITPATGHNCDYTEFKEATCTTAGTRTGVCKTCHKTVTEETTPATGHVNTRTEVISTCSPFVKNCEKTICTACDAVLSTVEKEPLPHKPTVTVRLDVACQTLCDQGNSFYLIPNSSTVIFYNKYLHYSDWVIEACPECNFIFLDTSRFAHTQQEAAEIMLGYINEFRAETYGTHAYDISLNDYLMGSCNYTINDGQKPEGNFYVNGLERVEEMALPDFSPTLQIQFNEWKNHAYIRSVLLNTEIKYFGFAYLENTSFRDYLVTRVLFAKDATPHG